MTTAIRIHTTGGPGVLQADQIQTPQPGPGQVLVDVAAAGVNFIDVYTRQGHYPIPLPATIGKEGAGRIAAVGAGVTGFAPGDRVSWPFSDGSYASQAVVPVSNAVHVPDSVSDVVAAAAMLQGLTAHYLVHSITPLAEGDVALVHAGAGGVGLLLTQMLAHVGVRVITTVSSEPKAELSRAAGGEPLVGYDSFAARVRDLTGGTGVRIVYDGVGRDTFEPSIDALRVRGTMVLFGAASGPVPPVDPQIFNRKGSLTFTRPSLGHFIAERDELDWRAADLFALIESGRLDVHIGATYPLADAAEAHRALEGRLTTGKVLLIP